MGIDSIHARIDSGKSPPFEKDSLKQRQRLAVANLEWPAQHVVQLGARVDAHRLENRGVDVGRGTGVGCGLGAFAVTAAVNWCAATYFAFGMTAFANFAVEMK